MTRAWLLLALVLPATALAHRAPEPATDVFGRALPHDDGRPTLSLYINRDNRALLRERAMRLVFDARAATPVVIVHVDLRDIPGWLHGMARREIRKSWQECLADVSRRYAAAGELAPPWLAGALYMVADGDGDAHRALGLEKRFREPWVVGRGSDGHELAKGPFRAVAATLGRLLTTPADVGGAFTAR